MKRILKYLSLCLAAIGALSCIENDLSYPYAPAEISSFVVKGQKSVAIDAETRTVDIVLEEDADISSVEILECSFTNDAKVVGGMPTYLDLRGPVTLVLKVYEEYEWTIKATQPIERYIRCDNQVGEAVIDIEEKSAYVYVSRNQSLSDVRFTGMKLEPEGSVITKTQGFIWGNQATVAETQDCVFPMVLDCVLMRYFYVDYQGGEIKWSVKVMQKAVELEISSVNPWACFAGIKGMTNGEGNPTLEYRKAADSEWTAYPDMSVSGTDVSALLKGLEPETDYLVRLVDGEKMSSEYAFTTEAAPQLENFSYDDWYMDGKAWMPNLNSSVQIWDTANKGSASLGYNPTLPEEEIVVEGKAVKMETIQVNIIGIKKLAAGNIYTGKFDKLAGIGAELDWGVPFGARPLALRGWYRYIPQTINIAEDKDYKDKLGQADECQIQIFLAEWDKPFHVNSAKKQFVDRNDKSIIAFSEFCSDKTNSGYEKFTLPVVYNDDRMPTYIIISACASRYGNFFVGGLGSLLYVDEFELVYDPDELTPEEYELVFSKIKPY